MGAPYGLLFFAPKQTPFNQCSSICMLIACFNHAMWLF